MIIIMIIIIGHLERLNLRKVQGGLQHFKSAVSNIT